jgi:hypothetical protein
MKKAPSHASACGELEHSFAPSTKINVSVGDLERGVLAPVDDDGGDDGSLNVSGSVSDSDGGAPLAATTST